MKKIMLVVSCAALIAALTGCNTTAEQEKKAMDEPFKQEREFMRQAIKQHSPDVMRVDIIDSTLVYTHIYDGIIDVKAYTFDGDVCADEIQCGTLGRNAAVRAYGGIQQVKGTSACQLKMGVANARIGDSSEIANGDLGW